MNTQRTAPNHDLSALISGLKSDGIVTLPNLVSVERLLGMQQAFASRLRHLCLSDVDGFEKTETLRHMVQDVLGLDQAFVDLALHPVVTGVIRAYVGESFALCEAKGWKSLPTKKDYHGWHGDAWYDQAQTDDIPHEVKLVVYLTDVRSGAFHYVRGSHRREHPRNIRQAELAEVLPEDILEMTGPAGTAILFDTSGIHRQGMPILEPRQAVFYAYHDPHVPLQAEDVAYNRYHPLMLNAAFLGDLTKEEMRVLGFGNKMQHQPAFARKPRFPVFHGLVRRAYDSRLSLDAFWQKWSYRLKRLSGR